MRDSAQQPPLLRGIADSLLATDGYKSAVREVVLIAGAYFAYMFVRNSLVSEVEVLGFENASSLISFEQAAGAFWEASWQAWALEHGGAWVMQLFNYLYIVTYFPIIAVTAVFFYWKRRERYFYYRALILLTFVAALIIFASFPLAPPRLVEGFGFVDGIAVYGPGWYASRETASYYNIYAAMPSLHFSLDVHLRLPVLEHRSQGAQAPGGALSHGDVLRHHHHRESLHRRRHRRHCDGGRGLRPVRGMAAAGVDSGEDTAEPPGPADGGSGVWLRAEPARPFLKYTAVCGGGQSVDALRAAPGFR